MIDYSVNGTNFTTDGVYVSDSKGIVGGLKLRRPVTQEWPDYHGEVVDMAAPRYEARDITLECFMKATTKETFLTGVQTFLARWMSASMKRLMIIVDSSKPLIYDVYLSQGPDIDKKWNDATMVGTFSLKLREPEPVKMVYKFIAVDYTTLTSGLIVYRKGERDGMYVIDKSEDGGVTWELDLVQLELDEDSIIIDIDAGVSGYRHVIRNEAYCIDHELTLTGFAGVENTDWENVYNTNMI